MLQCHSSRRTSLDQFLHDALKDAFSYDRIARYFSSSILEITGEAIEGVKSVKRMVYFLDNSC